MYTRMLLALALVLGLLVPTAATAAPLAGPCISGGGYNSACDANQDGSITVTDIQLTAGHWNQTGTFVSDSNHTHLGQTWTGASNPLKIQGAFGSPDYAPLVLYNTQGHGLAIPSASINGIYVGTAGAYGMVVNAAAQDGVYVGAAGSPSSSSASTESNGFEVAGAQGNGLYIGRADSNGVYVNSAGGYGVRVSMAEFDGVNVAGGSWAGWFYGNIYVDGNCVGCRPANFAVNVGGRTLQPGDVVSVRAVTETDFDTGPALWQVVPAQASQAAVGVVAGRAELVTEEDHRPSETGKRLVPRAGAAAPGDYVTIVFSGPMQVKVAPGVGAIAAGERLTAAADGRVRPLQTRTIEGMLVTEGAPVLGVAIDASQDGLVWVLVNP